MDHTIALIRRAHEGDENARAQLVEENTGLIWCVVKRFYGRGTEAEDLFQIGSIGLLKAIDKFDLGYDVKFSTYAVPMITGEIKRFLRDDGMLKVSRSLKEIAYKAYQAKEALTEKLGREPLLEEIAEETGVEKEEDVMIHSGLVMNIKTHECTLNEKPLSLTPTEFSILRILCQQKGNVVSAEELFHQIWGDEYFSKSNNTITVHIRHLREKMGDSFEDPKYIKTIWGCGYKIES